MSGTEKDFKIKKGLIVTEGITLGGHTFNDIDIGTEFVDTDDHLMSSGAIKEYVDANAGGIASLAADDTPQLGGDLDVNGNSIVSTSNAAINITPNGTGDIQLNADTIRVGDSSADVTIAPNISSTTAKIQFQSDGDVLMRTASGTGDMYLNANTLMSMQATTFRFGVSGGNPTLTTLGTSDLTLNTNSGTNSGSIVIADGANSDISITPNGTGIVDISTALEVGTGTQPLSANGVVTIINDDSDTTKTLLLVDNESDATNGPVLTLYRNTASPADGDILGKIELNGEDSTGNPRAYGSIIQESTDVTGGSHDGTMIFNVADAGSQVDFMTVGKSTVTTTTASSGVRAFTGSVITYSGTGTQPLSRDEHGGAYVRATGAGTFTLWDGPKIGDQVVVISDHAGTTTIDGYSNDTINGAANTTITTQYNAKTFIATSSSTWIALG